MNLDAINPTPRDNQGADQATKQNFQNSNGGGDEQPRAE